MLANAVLNKLDWFLQSKGFYGTAKRRRSSHGLPNIRFCRYADDWCVFITRGSRQYAARLENEIRDFLQETCGLELSAEKTRITHVRDGYDFLGFHVSVGVGQSGRLVPKVKLGRKAIAKIRGDLKWKALIRDGFHCRGCAVTVTSKTSQADHIIPVNRFANLKMANDLDNIQTLCLYCHRLKTERTQRVQNHLESRMLGNLHVRFGVGVGVQLPGLHH